MAMKRPPVKIPPPPAGCRNRAAEALDWTFEVTAPLCMFHGKYLRPDKIRVEGIL